MIKYYNINKASFKEDPVFGVQAPTSCPGVPKEILNPRNTWSDKDAYDQKAAHLAKLFEENFRQFEDDTPDEVRAAGPRATAKV